MVSKIDEILFYDIYSFKEITDCRIKVDLLPSVTRERNEIISMCVSSCENYLAVITGKNLIMAEQKPNQVFIFKKSKNLNVNADIAAKFDFLKKVRVAEHPEFCKKVCMQFMFKNTKYDREPDTLIFARRDAII